MCDGGPHPVDRHEIGTLQLAQVEALVVVGGGEIGFAAVVEVANVAHRDHVAFDCGVGQHRHVGLPVALIGRFDAAPPCHHYCEQHEVNDKGAPTPVPKAKCN